MSLPKQLCRLPTVGKFQPSLLPRREAAPLLRWGRRWALHCLGDCHLARDRITASGLLPITFYLAVVTTFEERLVLHVASIGVVDASLAQPLEVLR